MKILELIPTTILAKILTNQDIKINKIEKIFFKSKLDFDVFNIFNKFVKLDSDEASIIIELLQTFEPFIITKEDLECVSYELKPLKFEETREAIEDLDCIESIKLFIIVEYLYKNYKIKILDKKKLAIIQNLRLFKKLNKIFKEVCYGKGLKEYYDSNINSVKNDLEYLEKYINALE